MFEPSQQSTGFASFDSPTQNLRRRGAYSDGFNDYSQYDESKSKEMRSKIMKGIRNFDLYPKTNSVATKKTSLGGSGMCYSS